MKKMLALLLSAVMMISCAAPCFAADEKVKITMWHALTEAEFDLFNSFIEEFNEQSETTEIEMVYVAADEQTKQMTIGNLAGNLPDMVRLDNPDTAFFASTGVLYNVTDLYNEWNADGSNEFQEGPMNSCTLDGEIYGLPSLCNCIALFYNKAMLEEAGVEPPTNWTELKEASAALTNDDHYGFAMCCVGTEEGTFQFMPFLYSAGADINSINSEGSIEAIQLLADLVSDGYMSKDCLNWTQADVEKQFASGQAAMMINGSWQLPSLANDCPDTEYGLVLIPKADDGEYTSCLGGENFVITSACEHPENAWEFMTWWCSAENNPRICKALTRFSARVDADNETVFADDPDMLFFADAIQYAVARVHPAWTELSNYIQDYIQSVISGSDTAEHAAQVCQDAIDAIEY